MNSINTNILHPYQLTQSKLHSSTNNFEATPMISNEDKKVENNVIVDSTLDSFKVKKIKEQIENGTYELKMNETISKIVDELF